MAKSGTPSRAVLEARARRGLRSSQDEVEIQWYIDEVLSKIKVTALNRVNIATEYVKSKVVKNISIPVTKVKIGGKVRVTERSKPGEFPRADTTLLMKTIFGEVIESPPGVYNGYVGTPLDYGVELELKRNRSFLVRTLEEERSRVMQILTGPIQ